MTGIPLRSWQSSADFHQALGTSSSTNPLQILAHLTGLRAGSSNELPGSVVAFADQNGLRAGDVIVSANNQNVSQPSDIEAEWTKSRQQNKPILFRINRQGQTLFVAVAMAKS